MVKLKIRGNSKTDEAEKVPELEFYLELDDDSGNLILHADADDGGEWEILYITPEGKYSLATDVGDHIGLQVTRDGRIKRGTL